MFFDVVELGNEEKTQQNEQPVGELAQDLLSMLDEWHAHREIWDDELDALINLWNYEIRTTNRKRLEWGPKGTKYLAPSSANSCPRELYMKLTGAPRDEQPGQPHQGRWRRMGTAYGDMIQRDLLFIEKHYEKEFNKAPAFVPEYVDVNGKLYPAWEKFAQVIKWEYHRGYKIPFLGQPDGILRHTATGKRVGLEVKSKQTTAAQTTHYSMRQEKEDHFKQCVAYSLMYGVDDYIILYGNMSKKAWSMTPEEYRKNPDLRAFHVHITDKDRVELLDYLADVMDAVTTKTPLPLDLSKWEFNNYKTACALSLTDQELEQLEDFVSRVRRSGLSDKQKAGYWDALHFIKKVRGAA